MRDVYNGADTEYSNPENNADHSFDVDPEYGSGHPKRRNQRDRRKSADSEYGSATNNRVGDTPGTIRGGARAVSGRKRRRKILRNRADRHLTNDGRKSFDGNNRGSSRVGHHHGGCSPADERKTTWSDGNFRTNNNADTHNNGIGNMYDNSHANQQSIRTALHSF